MRCVRRAVALTLSLLLVTGLAGCVGNARTTGAYRGKAHHSAQSAVSALETALLAVQSSAKGNLLDNYLETVLSEAEDALGSVQQQFDSIQPPNNSEADQLRDRLDTLLTKGSGTLSDLRIAARRDEQGEMVKTSQDIPPLVTKLNAYAQETA